MAYYAGLDVGLKSTFICVVDEKGKVMLEETVASAPDIIARALRKRKLCYKCVGLETGQLSIWLTKGLMAEGLPVVCMDARQVAAGLSARVNKTDKNDARGIAHLLRCGLYREVHIKSDQSCEQKVLLGTRRKLVEQSCAMEGSIRGLLKIYGIRLGSARRSTFIPSIHAAIKNLSVSVQTAVGTLAEALAHLRGALEKLDASVREAAESDPQCKLLMTVPGVGPVVAMHYVAAIDGSGRFHNARSVGAYLGLTPRQYASGETQRQGSISRCGPIHCRRMLYEAANNILNICKRPSALRTWGLKLARKKGHRKASVAVARKLAIIMQCMLVSNQPFKDGKQAA
jgi:transposase